MVVMVAILDFLAKFGNHADWQQAEGSCNVLHQVAAPAPRTGSNSCCFGWLCRDLRDCQACASAHPLARVREGLAQSWQSLTR